MFIDGERLVVEDLGKEGGGNDVVKSKLNPNLERQITVLLFIVLVTATLNIKYGQAHRDFTKRFEIIASTYSSESIHSHAYLHTCMFFFSFR